MDLNIISFIFVNNHIVVVVRVTNCST